MTKALLRSRLIVRNIEQTFIFFTPARLVASRVEDLAGVVPDPTIEKQPDPDLTFMIDRKIGGILHIIASF